MMDASEWLSLHGEDRRSALEEAASLLLREYRRRFRDLVPIDLVRLSACLGARIERVRGLTSEALLLPVSGGFRVLVRTGLKFARFRSCVAHELAHTLFYWKEGDRPRRLRKTSKEEEVFCLDVARRVLAPSWMLASFHEPALPDAQTLFANLIQRLQISRDVAAQVMLQDYLLASGIAGRWSKRNGSWILDPGRFYASPTLSANERRGLRLAVQQVLEGEPGQNEPIRITVDIESSSESAFVLVEVPREKL